MRMAPTLTYSLMSSIRLASRTGCRQQPLDADRSLILRWRDQPLATLTDGMVQSPYHVVRHLRQSRQAVARTNAWAPGQRGGPAPWQQHRAQGLPDARRWPRVSAPHRMAGHVLWSHRDDADRSAQCYNPLCYCRLPSGRHGTPWGRSSGRGEPTP